MINLLFSENFPTYFTQLHEYKGCFQPYNLHLIAVFKKIHPVVLLVICSYSKFISRFVPVGIIGAF